jgi:hypothetical protein
VRSPDAQERHQYVSNDGFTDGSASETRSCARSAFRTPSRALSKNVKFGWSAHSMDHGFNFWASERPLVIVELLECRIHIDHRASS